MTYLERFSFFIGKSSVFAVFERPLYKEKLFKYLKSRMYDSFFFFSCSLQLDFSEYQTSLSEKAMAPHSSTLAWKIPWAVEPRRLQSMGSLRVGHNWATSLSLFTFMHWRRKWQPTPVFLPGESQGQGSLVAAVYGVVQGQTRLKQLSSLLFSQFSAFKCANINLAIACKHPWISFATLSQTH